MNISLSFSNCEEIVELAKAIVDEYPSDITISVSDLLGKRVPPPQADCDDELSLSELSLYAAGRLSAYFTCADAGLMTTEQIARIMEMDAKRLKSMQCTWKTGGIVAQRDAFKEATIAEAREATERAGQL